MVLLSEVVIFVVERPGRKKEKTIKERPKVKRYTTKPEPINIVLGLNEYFIYSSNIQAFISSRQYLKTDCLQSVLKLCYGIN